MTPNLVPSDFFWMDFQFTENSSEVGIFKAPLNLVQRFDTYIATKLNVIRISRKNLVKTNTNFYKLLNNHRFDCVVHFQTTIRKPLNRKLCQFNRISIFFYWSPWFHEIFVCLSLNDTMYELKFSKNSWRTNGRPNFFSDFWPMLYVFSRHFLNSNNSIM